MPMSAEWLKNLKTMRRVTWGFASLGQKPDFRFGEEGEGVLPQGEELCKK